jgi:hypothetical protein
VGKRCWDLFEQKWRENSTSSKLEAAAAAAACLHYANTTLENVLLAVAAVKAQFALSGNEVGSDKQTPAAKAKTI